MSIANYRTILEVKRYSQSTVDSYLNAVQLALTYFKKPLSNVEESDLHQFMYFLIHKKKISYAYQKQIVCALKTYYHEVLDKSIHLEFLLPKFKPFKLPVVLSVQEVKKILENISNVKHQALISLMYSAGLRVGELLHIKIGDIDSNLMVIRIKGGKGNKDRNLPLSIRILELLRTYVKEYRPKIYLFESPSGGVYSAASVNAIIKKACSRAKINKQVTAHTFRHSYATHLLESGTDVRVIQELLGHRSIKTTMLYTHIAAPALLDIQSPFDLL